MMPFRQITALCLAFSVAACEPPTGHMCLGASSDASAGQALSVYEQCVKFKTERLPDNILSRLQHGARFTGSSAGPIEVRLPEGDYDWILTEVGLDAKVDHAGLPSLLGHVFWRGYLHPPEELLLSSPRWRIGVLTLVGEETANVPDDAWQVTRIAGRGIYVGDATSLQRWWAEL